MFYAHFVLAKKGPLARIWLAAHWDKKLTKAHVFETNIETSVEGILQPKVKMALRTSGHLLLGIVRIYSRKAKYLLADCNEAFIKIKIAFRPGVVDLPEGNREAAVAAITLPEVFHDFDTALPDITIDMDAQVSLNQSRAEDITLKEDYGNLSLMADDGFDDMGFDEPEDARNAGSMEDGFDHASLLLCEDPDRQQEKADESTAGVSNVSMGKHKLSLDAPLKDDGFGGTVGEGLLDGETGGLFEPAGLFDDAPLGPVELDTTPAEATSAVTSEQETEKPQQDEQQQKQQQQTQQQQQQQQQQPPPPQTEDDSDDDIYDMAPGSIGAPSPPSSPESPGPPLASEVPIPEPETRVPEEPVVHAQQNPLDSVPSDPPSDPIQIPDIPPPPPPPVQEEEMPPPPPIPPVQALLDHSAMMNHDAESFSLAPLDAMIGHGAERSVKAKRKRKLVVDEIKSISGEEMKAQLSDTTDIVATLDLAPPTKRLMHWKETGGVEKLFSLPGHRILSKTLTRSYLRHLTTRSVENEVYGDDDQDELETEIDKPREEEIAVSNKRRRLMEPELPHDLSHLESFHLDASRPSFSSDPSLPHASLDVLFPPGQPPLMEPQMVQQMLPPDLHQLPNIPHMMDSMNNQGPSLNSITPSIQNEVLPDHSTIEPQHLLSSTLPPEQIQLPPPPMQPPPQLQQPLTDKHIPMSNHIDPQPPQQLQLQQHQQQQLQQQQQQLQQMLPPSTTDFLNTHNSEEPRVNGLHSSNMDDDATQPLLDQYPQIPQEEPLPNNIPEPPLAPTDVPIVQNGIEPPSSDAQSASNLLFDSLIGDVQQTQSSSATFVNDADDGGQNNKPNEFAGSDDEDDYAAPASVGPVFPDEQMADETYEQFEERILTKRTTHLLHCINNSLENHGKVSFANLVRNNKRKQVAQKFYTFLVLKKQQAVELEQDSTFGDLIVTRGPKYSAVYNGN